MYTRKEWFETWFDSPYYHILYDHRNEEEASNFILNLKDRLHLGKNNSVLDLGCGAGRHAAFLSEFTGQVVGLDLSENSIQQADKNYPRKNLEFYVHDMRLPFRINYFDHIFNFFTSFGYFRSVQDNLKVLRSAHKGLKPGGKLLIDFMNAPLVIKNLVEREEISKQGISFYIRREVVDNKILKHIKFDAEGKVYSFTESVQAIDRDTFHALIAKAGFEPLEEFGNYELAPYDVKESPRYILLAQKPLV
ncbi:MAG: class I SAM-dependent methyltransferase [Bacteroidetes bacterium]|nr:class I SAM-dependent methyltransferase [Bacteroidota bacterium]